jgi:hypothetical protein
MLGTIVAAVIAAWVIWVYWDATSHKIGKIPEAGGFLNMSAGAWCFVSFWLFGFVAYLWKRDRLIALAKTHPVEVKKRWLKLTVVCLVCAWFVWILAADAKL